MTDKQADRRRQALGRDGWTAFMRVLLSAFQCAPGLGSEPGTGWHWATTLPRLGHEVTVLTSSTQRELILSAGPQSADFRFVDDPWALPEHGVPPLVRSYDFYRRWQDAALRQIAAEAQHYDVAHHVTWASLHLGSQLWRLPVPLIYGPIGGGQTAPPGYGRYFGRGWATETMRTAATGSLLKLNKRSRETLRNSAVTLVCNSATEAAVKRLGARDVRFMLADGLREPEPGGAPHAAAGHSRWCSGSGGCSRASHRSSPSRHSRTCAGPCPRAWSWPATARSGGRCGRPSTG